MKKLQNNYTTPEQSKRLLELGVPANSADCMNFGNADIFQIPFQRPFSEHLEFHVRGDMRNMYMPCWSVGRLIEILEIILGRPWSDYQLLGKQGTLLERVLSDFEDVVRYKEILKDNRIDFSKVEEL